jgi:glutamate-ammonia-ligase adenylyltransferase
MSVTDEEVDRSAAPGAVRIALAQLADAEPDAARLLADDADLRRAVVAVTAASRSMTRVVVADGLALEVLGHLDRRPQPPNGDADSLARWKRLELLRIAARDLIGLDDLPTTGRLLADLADDVLGQAHRLAGPHAVGLAVVAMGKAGARELNYASDVDLLFVGEGDARPLLEAGRRCFRLDADLRPEGRDGPLVRSLASYEAYWDRWAHTWEFQALLKARPVAGPLDLQERFREAADRRVWGRPFGAEELRSVRSMKARAEAEVARKGLTTRELKRGRGGIRDIEFAVQLLQLVHGRADEDLRTPATFDALAELAAAGYVGEEDARLLAEAYTFLRVVEHRLQLVDEAQVHAVPTARPALEHLARVLGYRDDERTTAVARFEAELVRHQAVARSIHERLFFRPLLEAFTTSPAAAADGPPLTAEAARDRLSALGFTDAERTRQAVLELTRGMRRASRLMSALLPLLLEWLSESPDPDLGLLGLRTLATGSHRSARLAETFRESPEAARRLCTLAGTSRLLTSLVERQPDLLGCLAHDEALAPLDRDELVRRARAAMAVRNPDDRAAALQRLRQAELFRIATAGLLDVLPPGVTVGSALSSLAEAVLEAALEAAEPAVPMAVIAMGRLGGRELGFASDLDVVLFHDERSAGGAGEADAAAGRFLKLLRGATPAQQVWDIDLDLRPEGKQGRLASSLTGFQGYLQRWALTWERQALVRGRPCAGDRAVQSWWQDIVDAWVWQRPFTGDEAREVRRMKARVERERIPPHEDPAFHLKLGRGSLSDVEWTVQLLQLQHGVRGPSTLPALGALVAGGAIPAEDATILATAWRFCEAARNRWFLVKGAPGDSLPSQADQLGRLARSLDTTAAGLRNDYRRVTRRARAVVEERFYAP